MAGNHLVMLGSIDCTLHITLKSVLQFLTSLSVGTFAISWFTRECLAWAMPKEFENVALTDSDNNQQYIFTRDQQDRFDNHLLSTRAWFLECERNIVHKDEAYLVPPPSPSTNGTTQLQIEDEEEGEFEEDPFVTVASLDQTRGCGVCGSKRKNKNNAPPQPLVEEGNNGIVHDPLFPTV